MFLGPYLESSSDVSVQLLCLDSVGDTASSITISSPFLVMIRRRTRRRVTVN